MATQSDLEELYLLAVEIFRSDGIAKLVDEEGGVSGKVSMAFFVAASLVMVKTRNITESQKDAMRDSGDAMEIGILAAKFASDELKRRLDQHDPERN